MPRSAPELTVDATEEHIVEGGSVGAGSGPEADVATWRSFTRLFDGGTRLVVLSVVLAAGQAGRHVPVPAEAGVGAEHAGEAGGSRGVVERLHAQPAGGERRLRPQCRPVESGRAIAAHQSVLVFEELGRALVPGPVVGTDLAAQVLPWVASGEEVVSVVWER